MARISEISDTEFFRSGSGTPGKTYVNQPSTLPGNAVSTGHESNREFRSISPLCRSKITCQTSHTCTSILGDVCAGSPSTGRPNIYQKSPTQAGRLRAMSYNASNHFLLSPTISPSLTYQKRQRGTSGPTVASLQSPSVSRLRDRAASSSSRASRGKNGCRISNSATSHFDQDFATFKEAHLNNYLAVSYESQVPSFSGSDLDTLSTCGQCGQKKVFDSPYLGCHTSKYHLHEQELFIDMPKSRAKKSLNWKLEILENDQDQRDNELSFRSRITSMDTLCCRNRMNSQPSFVRFLCWKRGEKDRRKEDVKNSNFNSIGRINGLNGIVNEHESRTGTLNIMFQYFCGNKDLCVTLLDISSVTKRISKPYGVYVKVYLIPGKAQKQISRRQTGTNSSLKEEKFHFNVGLQLLLRCELMIKLYNKPSIFTLKKPLGKCTIPLHQYDSNAPAYVVWPVILYERNMEA